MRSKPLNLEGVPCHGDGFGTERKPGTLLEERSHRRWDWCWNIVQLELKFSMSSLVSHTDLADPSNRWKQQQK